MTHPIDNPDIPLPLGPAALDLPKISPGDTLKNVPEGYFHGGAKAEINYWRNRATTSEARLLLRLKEIDELKVKIAELEAKT